MLKSDFLDNRLPKRKEKRFLFDYRFCIALYVKNRDLHRDWC